MTFRDTLGRAPIILPGPLLRPVQSGGARLPAAAAIDGASAVVHSRAQTGRSACHRPPTRQPCPCLPLSGDPLPLPPPDRRPLSRDPCSVSPPSCRLPDLPRRAATSDVVPLPLFPVSGERSTIVREALLIIENGKDQNRLPPGTSADASPTDPGCIKFEYESPYRK